MTNAIPVDLMKVIYGKALAIGHCALVNSAQWDLRKHILTERNMRNVNIWRNFVLPVLHFRRSAWDSSITHFTRSTAHSARSLISLA